MARIDNNYELNKIAESKITDFLLKYCYPLLFDSAERIDDKERQQRGIDVIAIKDGWSETHDIKAQCSARYLNHPTPTFVYELLTYQYRNETVGWALKDSDTETYALCWIPKVDVDEKGQLIDAEHIYEVEVMFVDKTNLDEYLESIGATKEILLARARDMAKTKIHRMIPVTDSADTDEMHISYSDDLKEKSINLVIKKRVLKRFAYKHVRVTQNSITDIDNTLI